MMRKCLATQIGKNVQLYINDVVITTKQGSSLIDDLKETFDNLDKFCLKLNPTKCSFGVPAGELMGYLVSARGIEANPEKIQAIVRTRKPTKLKEIQQLTRRVAALSRFVAGLGEKALPFYALIKQGEKLEWNDEADKAFEHLKRTISKPLVLVAPKEKRTNPAIHCSHTSGGQHSSRGGARRRREDSWSSAASILHQRGAITIQAALPAVSETCVWSIHNNKKVTTLFFGAPNNSSQ
jgi:hypothetical protein